MKKNTITACLCLVLAVAIMAYSGMNFLAARELPLPEWGPSVTEVKMLSEWFDGLEGTNGDTPVYVLEGKKPGGSMLILGGTHANEVSGYMSAFTFIENAVVEEGTVYVIPYTNHSAMTHNDPSEGNLQYFTLTTASGERTFRYGSRATNPVDQWPDPDVYVHYPSGQQLSGSETRNINRAYPGRPDGNLTEKMAYGVASLIRAEDINLTFDLHEASPEYPVINATVAHQRAMGIAAEGCINIMLDGIEMSLEQSPTNFHGLTHRELGDYTDTYALLMETANASQGRLRGAPASIRCSAARMSATKLVSVWGCSMSHGQRVRHTQSKSAAVAIYRASMSILRPITKKTKTAPSFIVAFRVMTISILTLLTRISAVRNLPSF